MVQKTESTIELDFKSFGIKSDNEQLVWRIHEALSEIYAFGNLQLRAAWLYYGGILQAAKAFDMSVADYRILVEPKERLPRDIIAMFQDGKQCDPPSLSGRTKASFVIKYYDEWDLFRIGAEMLLEMSDEARTKLFSPTSVPITQDDLIQTANIWQERQNKRIVAKSKELLEIYLMTWSRRKYPRQFFECGWMHGVLKRAFEYKEEIRDSANIS